MKTKTALVAITLIFLASIVATGCASNRKCDGKRGVKTPMGRM